MIVQVFSIFDTVAGAFNRPFYTHNIAMAIRDVVKSLKKDPEFAENASECVLYHIASYDDATAVFTNLPQPISLGVLSEWLKRPQEHEEVFSPRRSEASNK